MVRFSAQAVGLIPAITLRQMGVEHALIDKLAHGPKAS